MPRDKKTVPSTVRSNMYPSVNAKKGEKYRKVDPATGKPSKAVNAIPRRAYAIRKVDPLTGKPSNAADAIPLRMYSNRINHPSDADITIPIISLTPMPQIQGRRLKTQPIQSMTTFFSQSNSTTDSEYASQEKEEQDSTGEFDMDACDFKGI